MVEEPVFGSADGNTDQTVAAAAAGHEQGSARGILRGAIQKVMEEIEHHERQARHHLQQAAELRKALKDSISFLHEQGEKKATPSAAKAARSDKPGAPEDKTKQGASVNRPKRPKKK
jgi:hypothetical protein